MSKVAKNTKKVATTEETQPKATETPVVEVAKKASAPRAKSAGKKETTSLKKKQVAQPLSLSPKKKTGAKASKAKETTESHPQEKSPKKDLKEEKKVKSPKRQVKIEEGVKTIYLGNLAFKSNEEQIKNFFSSCGNVVGVRLAKDQSGKHKGFAHLDFDSTEAVKKAVKLHGKELNGRPIKVDAAANKENPAKKAAAVSTEKGKKKATKEKHD